jgi:two-component system response regulator RegA
MWADDRRLSPGTDGQDERRARTVPMPRVAMAYLHTDAGARTLRSRPLDDALDRGPPLALHHAGALLLVDDEAYSRTRLTRRLTTTGFAVTGVASALEALQAAAESRFSHAVVELRIGRDSGLGLIAQLRAMDPKMRIVVVTGFDSFASVILALRAGAVDYLSKPVVADELIDALIGRGPSQPPVPDTPIALVRISWEHTQRVYEQCDRNVSSAARLLGMHRRTLQRILAKRAPPARGALRSTC